MLADAHAHFGSTKLQPGPARITFENKSGQRTLPGLWVHSPEMDSLSNRRRPVLTANRLLSNQTFRDLYRSGTFDPEQRFKITSLTILFTDLRGSTALYDRVGDLAAFDLVRSHFGELLAAVVGEGGAVVKTIGDAVMATFPTPDRALRAAMRMREAMRRINDERGGEDLALNIGLHEGPCLAVMLDDRQDYFGLTVNIASRVQELADPTAILATKPIVEAAETARTGRRLRLPDKLATTVAARRQRSLHDLRDPGAGRRQRPRREGERRHREPARRKSRVATVLHLSSSHFAGTNRRRGGVAPPRRRTVYLTSTNATTIRRETVASATRCPQLPETSSIEPSALTRATNPTCAA